MKSSFPVSLLYQKKQSTLRVESEKIYDIIEKLALLIHIIANVISGQSFMLIQVTNGHNHFDAQLCRSVLLLVNSCMERQEQRGYRCHPHLEIAFLSFFLIFRRTFVNDQKSFAIIREYEDRENGPIPMRAEVGFIIELFSKGIS